MQVKRQIIITMSEKEASQLTCEIDSLVVKFGELDNLKTLRLLIADG